MGIDLLVPLRGAVFLDRDGVLNKAVVRDGKPFPPTTPSELELVSGVGAALNILRQRNLALIVVSNQPDVARGATSRLEVERINEALAERLPLEQFFVCYHDDNDGCDCRKPKPGLFIKAAEQCRIDLASSFAIGDRWRDVDAAANAGVRAVFIDYGYAERHPRSTPSATVASVGDGAQWIVNELLLTSSAGAS